MKGHRVSHRKNARLHADHGCRWSTHPVLGALVELDGAAAERACKLPRCKAKFAAAADADRQAALDTLRRHLTAVDAPLGAVDLGPARTWRERARFVASEESDHARSAGHRRMRHPRPPADRLRPGQQRKRVWLRRRGRARRPCGLRGPAMRRSAKTPAALPPLPPGTPVCEPDPDWRH